MNTERFVFSVKNNSTGAGFVFHPRKQSISLRSNSLHWVRAACHLISSGAAGGIRLHSLNSFTRTGSAMNNFRFTKLSGFRPLSVPRSPLPESPAQSQNIQLSNNRPAFEE